ncbi:MAG: 50S ribosomal protein L10 [Nanoarchaeota archaeon]
MAHVSEAKKKEVSEFVELVQEYPVVGIVNMMGLPTPQLQAMREQLRGKVLIRMTKKTLAKRILDQAQKKKEGVEQLEGFLKGMPAFIFTSENPFSLFKTLKKNKSNAPAKAGQTAPGDIVVPAGPTPFAPGPVIGELGAVGIKAGIENGKVAIKQDSVVAKEGETISGQLAGLLTRLGIEPMEIGLDLVAVYQDGTIFEKKMLDIDEQEYLDNITSGHRWAFNLAMEAGVFTPETTELMFVKAQRDSTALAISEGIFTQDIMDVLLSKAAAQARSVSSVADI